MIRENIYGAVLNAITAITSAPYNLTIPTISRGFKHWVDVATEQCPAVFLVPVTEISKFVRGQPLKWTIGCEIWIYVKEDSANLGVQVVNPILDAIEKTLEPPSNTPYANTLSGIVHSCAINGTTHIHGGFIAGTTVAVVPIEIVTT